MEEWKDIPWYEWLYQVSNLWNVKSLYKYKKQLKWSLDGWWYVKVKLTTNWFSKTYSSHRLVAQAFIPNVENKPQVNHINWIKTDNRLENLEWCTPSENLKHSWANWLHKITEKHTSLISNFTKWKFWKLHHRSKKVNQYDLLWNFIKTWDSTMDIQRELWLNNWHISSCCKSQRKTTWWYIWKYFIN